MRKERSPPASFKRSPRPGFPSIPGGFQIPSEGRSKQKKKKTEASASAAHPRWTADRVPAPPASPNPGRPFLRSVGRPVKPEPHPRTLALLLTPRTPSTSPPPPTRRGSPPPVVGGSSTSSPHARVRTPSFWARERSVRRPPLGLRHPLAG